MSASDIFGNVADSFSIARPAIKFLGFVTSYGDCLYTTVDRLKASRHEVREDYYEMKRQDVVQRHDSNAFNRMTMTMISIEHSVDGVILIVNKKSVFGQMFSRASPELRTDIRKTFTSINVLKGEIVSVSMQARIALGVVAPDQMHTFRDNTNFFFIIPAPQIPLGRVPQFLHALPSFGFRVRGALPAARFGATMPADAGAAGAATTAAQEQDGDAIPLPLIKKTFTEVTDDGTPVVAIDALHERDVHEPEAGPSGLSEEEKAVFVSVDQDPDAPDTHDTAQATAAVVYVVFQADSQEPRPSETSISELSADRSDAGSEWKGVQRLTPVPFEERPL